MEIQDRTANRDRKYWTRYYTSRYLNLWLNRLEFEGLTKQQRLWLLKAIWNGTPVCAFKGINLEQSFLDALPEEAQNKLGGNVGLCFAPFAPQGYSMYDYETTGIVVNNRGVPYIPTSLQKVGKDIVVLHGLSDDSSLGAMAKTLILAIVDCEMASRKNRMLVFTNTGIEVNPDCPLNADELARKMLSDEAIALVKGGDTRSLTPFNAGTPYLIDKARIEKEARENELRCLLGLDSIATEKKERLLVDEANATQLVCTVSKDCFMNPLKEFFEEIKEVLGYDIKVIDPYEQKEEPKEEENDEILSD